MKKFYFTFGVSQGLLAHHYLVVEAESYEQARSIVFDTFGNKWAFQYSEDDWIIKRDSKAWYDFLNHIPDSYDKDTITQAELFGLREVKL